jgi:hypothetical protein
MEKSMRERNFVGQHFWGWEYMMSNVGRDETVIREFISDQEEERGDWTNSISEPANVKVAQRNCCSVSVPAQAPLSASDNKAPAKPGDTYLLVLKEKMKTKLLREAK